MAVSTFRQVQRRAQGTGRPDPLGWNRPPIGGFWIPREFHEWPEVAGLRNADVGTFLACAIWSHNQKAADVPPTYPKMVGADRSAVHRIADAGLWTPCTDRFGWDAFRPRTMASLRAGRGHRGVLINVTREFPMAPASAMAGLSAIGGWALAASWTLATGEPGLVPVDAEKSFCSAKDRRALVASGLWEPEFGGSWMSTGDHPYWANWAIVRDDDRAPIDPALREFIYARDGYRCLECGTPDDLSLDHIIPWSIGGPDTEDNLQTLCRPHNSSKGARY